MKLSVLDQSPVASGSDPAEALANTVDLARLAEELGYHRYWLAEHHSSQALAGPAPEILIAHVAAATSRIRVGSGGVMLPHYSPFKVAEQFRLLQALHPGRIDLGLGRAPGSDQLAALALQRNRSHPAGDDFPNQMAELLAWLQDTIPEDHPFRRVTAGPVTQGTPEVWLLSSSGYSAVLAAKLGIALSFAHFINPELSLEAMEAYRRHFEPSDMLPAPRAALSVSAICAPTDAEAQLLASSVKLWRRRLHRGLHGPIPAVQEALAELGEDGARVAVGDDRLVVGSPDTVAGHLQVLAEGHAVDEVMVVTITHDHGARRRSYELLAKAMGLPAARAASGRAHAGPDITP